MTTHGLGDLDDIGEIDELDWVVRTGVYRFISKHERPPTSDEAAGALGLPRERAELAFRRLDRHHALFLEPGTLTIRMAHPFSGVPTPFRVQAQGHAYWANCAWDMLGIPAALHADAELAARCGDPVDPAGTRVTLAVAGGRVAGHGEVVHFPLPFRRWY
ncbi:MAG TPA: organomercurial lyase, partial [Ktedonobacterales bacterium]